MADVLHMNPKPYIYQFSWSLRRHNCLEDCERQYYYQYYGSQNGFNSPIKSTRRTAYVMKELKTIPIWIGDIVHHLVKIILNNHFYKFGITKQKHEQILVSMMRKDWEDSRDKLVIEDPKVFVGLVEHYYDELKNDDSRLEDSIQIALNQIRLFYDLLDKGEMVVKNGEVLEFEQFREFFFFNTPIYLKIDFAQKTHDNKLHIFDWKTGKLNQESDDHQLNIYALYFQSNYKIPLNQIIARKIFLRENQVIYNRVDQNTIEETKVFIQNSITKMHSFGIDHNEANQVSEKLFQKRDENGNGCNTCNFRGLCFPKDYNYNFWWKKYIYSH